jgi:hypothetical protein
MERTPDLLPWPVPFARARHPSVSLITEQGGDAAILVVAPTGVDQYPKYTVRFGKALALLCFEEAYSLDRGYRALTGLDQSVCAYLWPRSACLESYRRGGEVFGWKDMQHYLVFGGDSIVEIVAAGEPEVHRHDERAVIETKHQV